VSAARKKNGRKGRAGRGAEGGNQGGGRGRTARKALSMSRLAIVVAVIVVIAIVALWWSSRPPVVRPPVTGAVAESTLSVTAILDSQRVAVTSQDWAASLHWSRLLSDREPNQPLRLLGYGMAWHN
jgi:hypothetical protein